MFGLFPFLLSHFFPPNKILLTFKLGKTHRQKYEHRDYISKLVK